MRQRILGQSILWLIALAVCAPPAWSANLIAVRVGNHPEFTRIVFEFDEPTGYQIARESGADENALVVTLEATSRSWNISPKGAAVASVTIAPGSNRTVANVVLRDTRTTLKEMILANPPRVVLDLIKENAPAAVKPAKATTKARAKVQPESEPERLAKLPVRVPGPPEIVKPARPEIEKLAPAPKEKPPVVAKVEPVRPAPVVKPIAPKPVAEPTATETETEWSEGAKNSAAVAKPSIPTPDPSKGFKEAEMAKLNAPEHTVEPVPSTEPDARPAPDRVEKSTPAPERTVRKPVARSEDASGGLGAYAWIAGLFAVAIGLGVFFMRRRSLPTDVDVTTLAVAAPDAEEGAAEERVPAGGFAVESEGEGAAAEAAEESAFDATQGGDASVENSAQPAELSTETHEGGSAGGAFGPGPGVPQPPEKEPSEDDEVEASLFDESLEGDKTMMNQDVNELSGSQTEIQPNFPPPVAPDPDVARLLQEMERRVTQLESRLDESVEARERLERQVAAQSEELRVQRAAIARTQRALRSLSRSEEEQATEPALRDPSKPSPRS